MFGYRLKISRQKEGKKQTDVAKILNISNTTLSNYEAEKDIIPLKYLIKICDICNISLDYLFGFNKEFNYIKVNKDFNLELHKQRLIELRKKNNLSQESLARIMKNNRSNISGYELGTHLISTLFLYELCLKYKISADYLMGKIDNPKTIKNFQL